MYEVRAEIVAKGNERPEEKIVDELDAGDYHADTTTTSIIETIELTSIPANYRGD